MSVELDNNLKKNLNNDFYNKFIELTSQVFQTLPQYKIIQIDHTHIFVCGNLISKYHIEGETNGVVLFLETFSNHLLEDQKFIFVGDLPWAKKDEWIKGLALLNPTQEQFKKLYYACFMGLGFPIFAEHLPLEYRELLIQAMGYPQLPDYEGLYNRYVDTSVAVSAIRTVSKKWEFIGEKELKIGLGNLLKSYRAILTFNKSWLKNPPEEEILIILRKLFTTKEIVDYFLPLLPCLPQKIETEESFFMFIDKKIEKVQLNYKSILSTYTAIIQLKELEQLLETLLNAFNKVQPGKISIISKVEQDKTKVVLNIESKDNTSNVILLNQMLEKLFVLYMDNAANFAYWEKAVYAVYLECIMTAKGSKSGSHTKSKI